MNYDQLVKDWAAEKIGVQPEKIENVQFGEWVGCYSSYTCDYGIMIHIKLTSGRTRDIPDWSFPDALKDFTEYVQAQERLPAKHAEYHNWED